jgi:hypothetical protein
MKQLDGLCFRCLSELVGPPPVGLHIPDKPCEEHQTPQDFIDQLPKMTLWRKIKWKWKHTPRAGK